MGPVKHRGYQEKEEFFAEVFFPAEVREEGYPLEQQLSMKKRCKREGTGVKRRVESVHIKRKRQNESGYVVWSKQVFLILIFLPKRRKLWQVTVVFVCVCVFSCEMFLVGKVHTLHIWIIRKMLCPFNDSCFFFSGWNSMLSLRLNRLSFFNSFLVFFVVFFL